MDASQLQIAIFVTITAFIAALTYLKCRRAKPQGAQTVEADNREVFLAGGGLTWFFVAGSITLTNLSTDQLVGMNGNQMLLLAWWELAAVCGLLILGKVFLPVYYRYRCTTTTELLERRYQDHRIRTLISLLFLAGSVGISMPAMLYSGSLFMQSMFGVDLPILAIALAFALAGAAYAVFGGLRAVAVSDAYSGVLLLSLGMVVVFLALRAIDYDFSGVPMERLTMIGGDDQPIPWHTLLTGMIFIQIFYWSTNQTITQRAMASPTLKEGQKGVFAAAWIRLLIVPPMIVVPGVVSYKLYGHIAQDAAYGRIVGEVLPFWLSGAFAAAICAAVLTSVNSVLNASTALYVCDIHEKYLSSKPNVRRLNALITLGIVAIALGLVPIYAAQESIINTVQQLYGILSMPILSAFIVGILFDRVDARAVIAAVVMGVAFYAYLAFFLQPWDLHYIHLMFITLILCVALALLISRFAFGTRPAYIGFPKA